MHMVDNTLLQSDSAFHLQPSVRCTHRPRYQTHSRGRSKKFRRFPASQPAASEYVIRAVALTKNRLLRDATNVFETPVRQPYTVSICTSPNPYSGAPEHLAHEES